MMDKNEIKKVDEWFSNHTEYFGTNHEGDAYTVSASDLEAFSDFLREEFPDLCLIRCCFGTVDDTIWFFRKDLEEAEFY